MSIAIGDPVGSGAVGSVLFVGSGPVLAQDQSNLFWDNTNKRLGIGTMSPQNGVTVSKSSTGAVRVDAINTNTSSTANAFLTVSVAGAGAGDPVLIYDVSGVANWAAGVDNSDSDKFKIAASAFLGTNDRLAITTDGKVGVNLTDPAAHLHIQSGTTSLPAFKLNPGAKLTSPQAGDLEFDGTQFWITQSGGQRRSLISDVANVRDFGAVGDGTTNDAAAIQAAVSSLADLTPGDGNGTGGVVYLPPGYKFGIGDTILIQSLRPIFIVSQMALGHFGQDLDGSIIPLVGLESDDDIFRWSAPNPAARGAAGGGGAIGLSFVDPAARLTGAITFRSALCLEDFGGSIVRDCQFHWLVAHAIRADNCVMSSIDRCVVRHCGNTDKPAVLLGVSNGAGGFAVQSTTLRDCRLEANFSAEYIRIPANNINNKILGCGFEAETTIAATNQIYIHDLAVWNILADNHFNRSTTTHLKLAGGQGSMVNCQSQNGNLTVPTLDVIGTQYRITNYQTIGGPTQTKKAISVTGPLNQLTDIVMTGGGNLYCSGLDCVLTNITCYGLDTTEPGQIHLDYGGATGVNITLIGAVINGNNVATAPGILAAGVYNRVIGCTVWRLNNANGIVSGTLTGHYIGNAVSDRHGHTLHVQPWRCGHWQPRVR
jgi:hypothetical protein